MNTLLIVYVLVDIIFLGTSIGLIIAGQMFMHHMDNLPLSVNDSPYVILLYYLPCVPIFVNGIISAATFLLSLPALALPMSLVWLRIHGWFVMICAVYSLVLGVLVWVDTLTERAAMFQAWKDIGPSVQTLLQERFQCCGYISAMEPLFVTDDVCPNALVASQTKPCVGPFTAFQDEFFNTVFTILFGIVAVDFVMLCCTAMVINQRREQRRYRKIDEKRGLSVI
ncbi:phospholipid scramblase 1 [Orbilia brochopaga]|uniref:Phospholipid scramblase 1 n=1 Tax=Orbilia brochopaga TaxID=3140254 RepID=A0AAV9V503_9PEZI